MQLFDKNRALHSGSVASLYFFFTVKCSTKGVELYLNCPNLLTTGSHHKDPCNSNGSRLDILGACMMSLSSLNEIHSRFVACIHL